MIIIDGYEGGVVLFMAKQEIRKTNRCHNIYSFLVADFQKNRVCVCLTFARLFDTDSSVNHTPYNRPESLVKKINKEGGKGAGRSGKENKKGPHWNLIAVVRRTKKSNGLIRSLSMSQWLKYFK